MGEMINARRAKVVLNYSGKDISRELSDDLIDFSYTDAEPGTLDDLQVKLDDVAHKWIGAWSPSIGDQILAYIKTVGWDKPGEIKKLPCGTFEVDSVDLAGPPDTVSIKAVSLPVTANIRQEKRTKAWEEASLRSIASEIAKRAGFSLLYEAHDNPKYERQDQQDISDLAFLNDLCKKEGIALKVTGKKLVLFDERVYEQKKPVLTLTRGTSDILGYSFSFSSQDVAYVACEINYQPAAVKTKTTKKKTDSKDKDKTSTKTATTTATKKDTKKKEKAAQPKPIKVTYRPPGAPANGPVLKLNQSVSSQAEALRVARNELRNKNKESGKASLSLMGDVRMAAGITLTLKGWGTFDGKYIIVSAAHAVSSSGYATNIEIRKVLGW